MWDIKNRIKWIRKYVTITKASSFLFICQVEVYLPKFMPLEFKALYDFEMTSGNIFFDLWYCTSYQTSLFINYVLTITSDYNNVHQKIIIIIIT